jgi:hypothetical protein
MSNFLTILFLEGGVDPLPSLSRFLLNGTILPPGFLVHHVSFVVGVINPFRALL